MAATPALSSAPRMLEPPDATPSSVTTGSRPGVGHTVSMCALSISGRASLPFAGQQAMRIAVGVNVRLQPRRFERWAQNLHDAIFMTVIAVDAQQAQEGFQEPVMVDGDALDHRPRSFA